MSAMPSPPGRISAREYLERERRAETRSEYHDGIVVAMAGASPDHVLIVSNLVRLLGQQSLDRPCRVYSTDLRVAAASGRRYFYPDVVMVCGPLEFEEGTRDTLTNPIVVVEVLSPSTELYDRGPKFQAYLRIESLREYVLVSTETRRIEVFRRGEGAGEWIYESCPFSPSPLELPSVGCKLPLDDVYRKVPFDDGAAAVPQ